MSLFQVDDESRASARCLHPESTKLMHSRKTTGHVDPSEAQHFCESKVVVSPLLPCASLSSRLSENRSILAMERRIQIRTKIELVRERPVEPRPCTHTTLNPSRFGRRAGWLASGREPLAWRCASGTKQDGNRIVCNATWPARRSTLRPKTAIAGLHLSSPEHAVVVAWTKRRQFRLWIGRNRARRCQPVGPTGVRAWNTFVRERCRSWQLWKFRPERAEPLARRIK
jgi:hypothetical protein